MDTEPVWLSLAVPSLRVWFHLSDKQGVLGRQGWAESALSFPRYWPGAEQFLPFLTRERAQPWPGRFSFSFKVRGAESGHLWEALHLLGPSPLALGLACWGPGNRAAEGLRGQGSSLQVLVVSGRSSWQTPKLSSTVRQSTGRSWVPFPQVTEHCRWRITSEGPPLTLRWAWKGPSFMWPHNTWQMVRSEGETVC